MKSQLTTRRLAGFTGWDLLIVVSTVALAFIVGIPTLMIPRSRTSGCRLGCVSNLKQIGLAFRMWSNDNQEQFPWQVSTKQGGTLEYAAQGGVLQHFQAISNELTTPKVLVCPSDRGRFRASSFHPMPGIGAGSVLTNAATQISYFVGLDANETRPQTILSGDRNVRSGVFAPGWIMMFTTNDPVKFTKELHDGTGCNVGLGDGSAQQVTVSAFAKQAQAAVFSSGQALVRLAMPQ